MPVNRRPTHGCLTCGELYICDNHVSSHAECDHMCPSCVREARGITWVTLDYDGSEDCDIDLSVDGVEIDDNSPEAADARFQALLDARKRDLRAASETAFLNDLFNLPAYQRRNS